MRHASQATAFGNITPFPARNTCPVHRNQNYGETKGSRGVVHNHADITVCSQCAHSIQIVDVGLPGLGRDSVNTVAVHSLGQGLQKALGGRQGQHTFTIVSVCA